MQISSGLTVSHKFEERGVDYYAFVVGYCSHLFRKRYCEIPVHLFSSSAQVHKQSGSCAVARGELRLN